MNDKNCMFQFATSKQSYYDTELITLEEALNLFEQNKELFVEELKKDSDPQMAVWIDCKHDCDYNTNLHYWDSCDVKVDNTGIWIRA